MRNLLIDTNKITPVKKTNLVSRVDQIVKKQDLYRVYKTVQKMINDSRLYDGDLCFIIEDNHFYIIGQEGSIALSNGLRALRKPIVADSVGEAGLVDIVTKNLVATKNDKGIVQIGDNIDVDNSGLISIPKATKDKYGVVQVGSGLMVDDGVVKLDIDQIPDVNFATEDKAGIIKPGIGMSTEEDGTLNIDMPLNEFVHFDTELDAYQGVVDLSKFGIDEINNPEIYLSSTKLIQDVDYNIDVDTKVLSLLETHGFKTTLEYIDFKPYEKVEATIATPNKLGNVKIGDGIYVDSDGTISTLTHRTIKCVGTVTKSDNKMSIIGYNNGERIYEPMVFMNGVKLNDSQFSIDNKNKILYINIELLNDDVFNVEYIDYPPKNMITSYIDAQALGGLYPSQYAKSNVKIIAGQGIQIDGNNTLNDNVTINLKKELLDDFGNIRIFGKTYEEFVWTLREDLIPKLLINANKPQYEIIEVEPEVRVINYTSNFSSSIMVYVDGVLLYPDKYKQDISNRSLELVTPFGTKSRVLIANISYAL